MNISIEVNRKRITEQIEPDLLLIDFLRRHGCSSVKRGCETANCGLCTVLLDEVPVLSCSVLTARADGHKVETLEGLQEEAEEKGKIRGEIQTQLDMLQVVMRKFGKTADEAMDMLEIEPERRESYKEKLQEMALQ